MDKGELLGKIRVLLGLQFGEKVLGVTLGFGEHFPDLVDNFFEEIEIALLG